jgi:predicted permease
MITAANASVLPQVVVYFALPALTFASAYQIEIKTTYWLPALMGWAQFALSFVFVTLVARVARWPKAETTALIMACGLGNTSFLGFPLLEVLYGPTAIPIAIICDQLGSFLVLSTFGILLISHAAGDRPSAGALLKRLVRFPSFPALLLGFALRHVSLPPAFIHALERIGSLLIPLALLHLGSQIQWQPREIVRLRGPLSVGLLFKLVLVPLFFAGCCVALNRYDFAATVTILESAMAPMLTAAILTSAFGLAPVLCNQITSLGMLLSFLTIPIWALVLRAMGFAGQ